MSSKKNPRLFMRQHADEVYDEDSLIELLKDGYATNEIFEEVKVIKRFKAKVNPPKTELSHYLTEVK